MNIPTNKPLERFSVKDVTIPISPRVDVNIRPENIKKDVSILGVTGTLEAKAKEKPTQSKNVQAIENRSLQINADVGYELRSVSVDAVNQSLIDGLIPENIKKGAWILGVEGQYQENEPEPIPTSASQFKFVGNQCVAFVGNPNEPQDMLHQEDIVIPRSYNVLREPVEYKGLKLNVQDYARKRCFLDAVRDFLTIVLTDGFGREDFCSDKMQLEERLNSYGSECYIKRMDVSEPFGFEFIVRNDRLPEFQQYIEYPIYISGPNLFFDNGRNAVEYLASQGLRNVEFYGNGTKETFTDGPDNVVNIIGGERGFKKVAGKLVLLDNIKQINSHGLQECYASVLQISEGLLRIEDNGAQNMYNLRNLVLPNSLTDIGFGAFVGASNIQRISIGSGTVSIGEHAFDANSMLHIEVSRDNTAYRTNNSERLLIENATQKVMLGTDFGYIDDELIKIIGDSAFEGHRTLVYADTNQVETIEPYAYANCKLINSIQINNVKTIGQQAFARCESLTQIDIPSTLTSLAYDAFIGCPRVASISVDPSNSTYDNREDCKAVIEKSTNKLVLGCYNTTIPNSVRIIGREAFNGVASLPEITIPEGVVTIEERVFASCGLLSKVTLPITLTEIGSGAFDTCDLLKDLYYNGTKEQWNAITKEYLGYSIETIHCSDGDITV